MNQRLKKINSGEKMNYVPVSVQYKKHMGLQDISENSSEFLFFIYLTDSI